MSLELLATTATDEALCRTAASTGDNAPPAPISRAQRIDGDGHGVVLLNDTYRVPPRSRMSSRRSRSSRANATSAVSTATSVPASPMAIPMSATASAGASLIAVTDHRHAVPVGLQRPHGREFVVGQHLGAPFIDSELVGYHRRGVGVIAGKHHDAAHPVCAAPLTGRCFRTDFVAQADQPDQFPVDRQQQRCFGLATTATVEDLPGVGVETIYHPG